jgi:hypothetical protein
LFVAGFSHYLSLGRDMLHLYGQPGRRLPAWFVEADWTADVAYHAGQLFARDDPDDFVAHAPPGRDYRIRVACPERAALEWLYVMPDELLFGNEVVDTLSGMTSLRPRRLQRLLEACKSVRVKRVFLILARHSGHAWYARLDRQRLDIGAGKRQLTPGGKLDREYGVMVPEAFADGA